jgi:hypothetical protein
VDAVRRPAGRQAPVRCFLAFFDHRSGPEMPKYALKADPQCKCQRSRPIMRVSKMVRHDPTSMAVAELWSLHEQVTSDSADSADSAGHADRLEAQRERFERLNAYYNQVVVELRASLDRTEDAMS